MQEENFDVLFINETWLNNNVNDAEINIPGYSILRKDRDNGRGGGVAVYLKNTLNAMFRDDITNGSDIETIWVEIIIKNVGAVLLGTIYRPPSADQKYYEQMLNVLDVASLENKEVVLTGDLNFDCLQDDHPSVKGICNCYDMTQMIDKPTRVAFTKDSNNEELNISKTLIDLMFSTCPEIHRNTQVKQYTISDHYVVKSTLYIETVQKHNTVTYRNYNSFNQESFIEDLKNSGLVESTTEIDNTNEAWQNFKCLFEEICAKHAPICHSRLKIRKNKWMDREILLSMYARDNLYKKAVKTKLEEDLNNYKTAKNKVTSMIRHKKKEYYEQVLVNNNDINSIWKVLNEVLPNKKYCQTVGKLTAANFVNHFSKVGEKISSQFDSFNTFSKNKQSLETTIKGPQSIYNFRMSTLNENMVEKALKSLKPKSSLDILYMDSKLLKTGAHILCKPLTHIFNLSIVNQTYVDDWKIGRVTPVYKGKGSHEEASNYRPISNNCHIGKILDKYVNTELMSYLTQHKFITMDQAAYLKNSSTQTSIHRAIEDWLEAYNESQVTIACFLDIKKCYDSIDHHILFSKLEHYGIKNDQLHWFKSYLKDRKMVVSFDNSLSEEKTVNIGIPQGSALGPTLFLVFINDLSQAFSKASINMYADDSLIYVTMDNFQDAISEMQIALNEASKWFKANCLLLNEEKCYLMYVNPKRNNHNVNLFLNDKELHETDNTNYLGVTIDNNLTFKDHVQKVKSKCNSKLAALKRLSKFLPKNTLEHIYNMTIEPTIDYCATIWGHVSQGNCDIAQRIQNMAARVICNNYDYIDTRGIDLVNYLGWRTFSERINYYTAVLIYKAVNDLTSPHIANLMTLNHDVNMYNTRSVDSNNLVIPMVIKEKFKNSLQYNGAKVWNNLTTELKCASSLKAFKRLYKNIHFT